MEWVTLFLNMPLLQVATLVLVIAILQHLGFPVVDLFKKIFKLNGENLQGQMSGQAKEVAADIRNALQPLLSQMDQLTQYANHDTTEHLMSLKEDLGELKQIKEIQCKKLDTMIEHLDDIRFNGVRIKK